MSASSEKEDDQLGTLPSNDKQPDNTATLDDNGIVNGHEAHNDGDEDDEDDEDGEDDEEEEPRLKYAKLTGSLASVYRNGDATSSSLLAGDKMVIGTHNGNIVSTAHVVLCLESLGSLRRISLDTVLSTGS